jgi:hypothetical protein
MCAINLEMTDVLQTLHPFPMYRQKLIKMPLTDTKNNTKKHKTWAGYFNKYKKFCNHRTHGLKESFTAYSTKDPQ